MNPNMPRKRVAIDVDSTIAEFLHLILRLHNEAGSTNYTLEDVVDWDLSGINMTNEQWLENYMKVWKEMTYEIGLLLDEKLLRKAEKYYDVVFLTSRKDGGIFESTAAPLGEWLKSHNLGDVKLVLSTPHRHKSELDYDFFIDDSPMLGEAMSSGEYKGKKLFLIDAAYNRKIADSRSVNRVKDVNDALSKLIAMEERSVPEHE